MIPEGKVVERGEACHARGRGNEKKLTMAAEHEAMAPQTRRNCSRIVLVLLSAASLSCALFYTVAHHQEHISSESTFARRIRIHQQLNSSSGVELTDSDGLLIEVAVQDSVGEEQVTLLAHTRSIDAKSIDQDSAEAVDAPTVAQSAIVAKEDSHNDATESSHKVKTQSAVDSSQQHGVVTTDTHGLLVEISSELDGTSKSINNTTTSHNPKQTKIINGVSTPRSSHPFIVRLHSSNPGSNPDKSPSTFYCGGTLISPDIIATAAHCLGDEAYVDIYSVDEKKSTSYKVLKSVIHPRYKQNSFGYDYALIQIQPHLEVTTNQDENGNEYWDLVKEYSWANSPPIMRLHRYEQTTECTALSRGEAKRVTTFTIMGFGRKSFPNGPISYSSLRTADVHYLLNAKCNEMYLKAPPSALPSKNRGMAVTDDMLCANDVEEKQDACSGDSGGPLLAKLPLPGITGGVWSLVGIISWGIGCALTKFPGVYSRIGTEVDWIERTICDGLSPKSCVFDDNGNFHLRDYAAEVLTKDTNKSPLQRQPASDTSDRTHSSSRISRKRVHLNFSFSTTDMIRQSTANRYACELLEGVITTNSPTSKPTSRTGQNSRPTKVGIGLDTNCPKSNKVDVRYFIDEKNKVRDCFWVKSRCRNRCVEYSSCCPQTCSQDRCHEADGVENAVLFDN